MSTPETTQTVWESVRGYISFLTPVVNVLIAVIMFYYVRDMDSNKESFEKLNDNIADMKTLIIKQGSDMGYVQNWMQKMEAKHDDDDRELARMKEKIHELEKEQIRSAR